jgi:hypothetical protein
MTPGANTKAIPKPTRNLRTTISTRLPAKPVSKAADDDMVVPKMAVIRGPIFAARMPPGTWKTPIPMKNADVVAPSPETFSLNSEAMKEKTAARLNQFTEYMILPKIRDTTAARLLQLFPVLISVAFLNPHEIVHMG